MLRPHRSLEFVAVLAATLLPVAQIAAQSPAKPPATAAHKSKSATKKRAPAPEVPQPPPAPPTLEQQPPVPPQVTYRDGQLSITSTNATLAQVLRSVQTQTGATIDMPFGAGSERVVATLGPGKPQAVLASLLNGSKFDYVILGMPNNPGTVQKVILMAKSGPSATPSPAMAAQNIRPQQPQGVEPPDDEYPANEPEVENPTPMQPGAPGFPGAENMQPETNQPGNRTPEQMLQELQRMQQQQQQMQQQLNPANQPQQPFGQPYNPNNQPQQPFPNQAQPSPQPQ